MKIFATGKIPVHIALSEVYAEEGLELYSAGDIKREIEDCYSQYTPAQSIPFTSEDEDRIQRETEISWLVHFGHYIRDSYDEIEENLAAERDADFAVSAYLADLYDSDNQPVDASHIAVSHSRAIRRKQNAKHNKRLRNSVIINSKSQHRFDVDCYYKAIVNRRIVSTHKSRTLRAVKLLKQAEKKKLITTEEFAAS